MAASLLERVPVQDITEQAREARPGPAIANVLAVVLVGIGWLAARLLSGLWLAAAWVFVAVRQGWREGRSAAWTDSVNARRRARAERAGPR